MKLMERILKFYVTHSKRFDACNYDIVGNDDGTSGYRCRICGYVSSEPWKICESCFYPLPLVGGRGNSQKP